MSLKDTDELSYKSLQNLYSTYFTLGHINTDVNSKFALISLICYITNRLKSKNPDVTFYQVVYKLASTKIPEENIKGLSIMCKDFSYGCTEFPTFGISDKDIPNKIKEILSNWTPF